MTKQAVKETTKDVVIPGTVAMGLLALVAQSLGYLPNAQANHNEHEVEWKAAFVAWDKNYREDQKATQTKFDKLTDVIVDLKSEISRLSGKLEK